MMLQSSKTVLLEPRPVLWGIVITVLVAILGGNASTLTGWYYGLTFPGFKPPDWVFGPAWTTIFVLTCYAGINSWRRAHPSRRSLILGLYLVNGGLNIFWSVLFFAMQRPDLAMFELPFLWLSIASLLWQTKGAGLLPKLALMPYIMWVTFAGALNWSIATLNGYL